MVYNLRFFFSSSKCSLFHNSNIFGSYIIHILYTGCAKIKNIIPTSKGYSNAPHIATITAMYIWTINHFFFALFLPMPELYLQIHLSTELRSSRRRLPIAPTLTTYSPIHQRCSTRKKHQTSRPFRGTSQRTV